MKSPTQTFITSTTQGLQLPSLEEMNKNVLDNLSSILGQPLNQDPTSNASVMINQHNLDLLNLAISFLSVLEKIENFFETQREEGIENGTYGGLRIALLNMGLFDDVAINETDINATMKIVLLIKYGTGITEAFNRLIGQTIHRNRAVGILTLADGANVSQPITGNTGQVFTYSWYYANRKTYNIKVGYVIDYEQQFSDYNFDNQIKVAIAALYSRNYNAIGKDVLIQDFFGIITNIAGLRHVDIAFTLPNPADPNNPLETYTNQDITIADTDFFQIGTITTEQITG
ncbi:MAG: DUF276 domain-containing protein [Alphaproteobacteria bacterium]|jgi:hypothetical protein|nr:DUF276 domain-containing protein [Alphaproteobacteria bacterium]